MARVGTSMTTGIETVATDMDTATDSVAVQQAVPALTVLCHGDVSRVGEMALVRNGTGLCRFAPSFFDPSGEARSMRALEDPHLSRTQMVFHVSDDGVSLDASAVGTSVKVDGAVLEGARRVGWGHGDLRRGVVLLLARRVVLLLHLHEPAPSVPVIGGLVGESAAMRRLRAEIRRVSDLDFPILLRGESGTGKELVAKAVHAASPRRRGPYLAVNLAAIPTTLASAELFGAEEGAHSGARKRRTGFFERASGGTLLLDEIGEADVDIQVMLLRALETRQVQPIGASAPRPVDLRIIAATDADLEAAMERGDFRSPLMHRLANYEIELPPLRRRRDDFGRLFFYFLRQELSSLGQEDRLSRDTRKPWASASVVARLAAYDWPGNVRQLRNVVRQLVVFSRDQERMAVPPRLQVLLDGGLDGPPGSASVTSSLSGSSFDWGMGSGSGTIPVPQSVRQASMYRDPAEITEEELRTALEHQNYQIRATAKALNVSRSSFYAVLKRFGVPTASDLSEDLIRRAFDRHGRSVEESARFLKVSYQGLRQRLSKLGLI